MNTPFETYGDASKPEEIPTAEDLKYYSELTLSEVVEMQQRNRVAAQELRSSIRTLVDRRLAREITLEQFKRVHSDAVERQTLFRRRHLGLSAELIQRRATNPPPRSV